MKGLILVPALAAAPMIHAETQYVIEQLVVNVNSAPDASGERVATIKSGDAVEVLESQGDQMRVHLANGTEGWVRKSYLSAEEPLRVRLNERTAEIEKLKQDVARLQAELASARGGGHGKPSGTQTNTESSSSANTTATTKPAAAPAVSAVPAAKPATAATVNAAPGAKPAAAAAANSAPDAAGAATNASQAAATDPAAGEPSYFMTPPEEPARPVWHWALGSFVIALGLGFLLGWQMLDRRIRRKYGGLRIY